MRVQSTKRITVSESFIRKKINTKTFFDIISNAIFIVLLLHFFLRRPIPQSSIFLICTSLSGHFGVIMPKTCRVIMFSLFLISASKIVTTPTVVINGVTFISFETN